MISNSIGISISGLPSSIIGGGSAPNPDFVSTWDTTQAGSASDTVVLPLLSGGTYNGTIDWGDGKTSPLSYANRTHVYASSGTYTITISGNQIEGWRFNNAGDKLKIINISNWGNLTITTNNAFTGCSNMDGTATDAPNIATTDLSGMFAACLSWNGEVEQFDYNGVTTLRSFLGTARSFNRPLNNMDVSTVLTFDTMLNNCSGFDQTLSNWDITAGTSFSNFFRQFGLLNIMSTPNYDATLIGWEATLQASFPGGAGYTPTISIDFASSQYTLGSAAETARTSLISNFGWTISDGGGV